MKWRWFRPRWPGLPVAATGFVFIALYLFVQFGDGFPTTPMTEARANDFFRKGVRPGQSREDVTAWLESRGIPPAIKTPPSLISYDVLTRSEDYAWMGGIGKRTVDECAGLRNAEVFSVIRVTYPDAGRAFNDKTSVWVYLFFDENGRLLRHWVNTEHDNL